MKNQKASKIDGHYSIRAGVNNQWFRTEKGKRIISSVIQRKKKGEKRGEARHARSRRRGIRKEMINRGCVGRNGVVSNVLASRDRLQNALDEDQSWVKTRSYR